MDRRVLVAGLLTAPASARVVSQAPVLEEAKVETEEVRRGGRGRGRRRGRSFAATRGRKVGWRLGRGRAWGRRRRFGW